MRRSPQVLDLKVALASKQKVLLQIRSLPLPPLCPLSSPQASFIPTYLFAMSALVFMHRLVLWVTQHCGPQERWRRRPPHCRRCGDGRGGFRGLEAAGAGLARLQLAQRLLPRLL